MMNLLLTTATVAALGTDPEQTKSVIADEDAKVVVDLFYEAQCPGCKKTITTSFATAAKADGFFDMATVNLYPYGNAKETEGDDGWEFTCQHGETECEWNKVEACSKNIISDTYKSFEFINCIELHDQGKNYATLAKTCSKQADTDD